MNKITIAIDCRLWNETGVGRYIRNLVWELAKIDKKNSYILFFRKNEFENVELPGENFKKSLADVRWHSIAEQTRLSKILEKENFDIIHFPYFSVPFPIKRPFIVTIHDLIINHLSTGKASTRNLFFYYLKHYGYRFVLWKAVRSAKKIIAVSNATKQEIIDHYHIAPDKIAVTLEGVDEKITSKTSKKIIDGEYFLYVGNAYPHKNLERLIKAFEVFKKQDKKNTKLVLVGKEDFFYKRLKKIVDPKFKDSILFYEKVSDSGLSSLYIYAKALIVPSLMEGFGLPAVEAMANNCLVLASDIPSLKEVCKDAAIYFNPVSITDISEKLEKVSDISQSNLEEKIKTGSKLVQEFSWKKMVAQTLDVYENSTRL